MKLLTKAILYLLIKNCYHSHKNTYTRIGGRYMLFFLAVIKDSDERNKLEELYLKYSKDMFKVAYRILNDYYLAQDAVQQSFIKLIDNLNKINDINCNKTKAFVVIIIRNVSINLYRKRKKVNFLWMRWNIIYLMINKSI